MKHLFIINPAAGKYDHTAEFTKAITACCTAHCLDYEIAVSTHPGHCRDIAGAAAQSGEEYRIYACGGDGTLNEVVNGVAGFSNVAITHYPGGSGNDFIRIFSEPAAFFQLERLLDCEEAQFDLIACGKIFSLNVCSIGLDARIGTSISKYKRLPFVTGAGAYVLSTIVNVIKGIHQPYRIKLDQLYIEGRQTLICICNGRWYGGGFHPVPDAEVDDGWLDVLLVKDVSRLTVAKVIGKYKAGLYRNYPALISHHRCKKISVYCDTEREVNLDGELLMAKTAEFEVSAEKIRFFYPKGLQWHAHELCKSAY